MADATPLDPIADSQCAAAAPRYRVSLLKGEHRWLFDWASGDEAALIARIADLARDPQIPFDWYDAAVVCKHIAQPSGLTQPPCS